ncbi:YciI family protein [Parasediminibacterium sp. JCM 36343]|uniref:YciI family protein n=1 Tax=Parasediminibacterium sp. JCM 36343 TaxID=3374279 RepID=UPI00397BD7DF
MKAFLLIFRRDAVTVSEEKRSPAEMEQMMKYWMDWIGGIAAQGKLLDPGNRLAVEGKVLKPNNIIVDGPYVEVKESIGGYIAVKADSLEEALELSKGCPILNVNGNVEIREIIKM